MREEHNAELLGRVDIEALASKLVDLFADAMQFRRKSCREAIEDGSVNTHAGLLHAIEDGGEREIDIAINTLTVGLFHRSAERRNECVNGGSTRSQRGRRGLAMARGHVRQRLRGMSGIQRIGKKHRIVKRAAQLNAKAVQHMERQLGIVSALWHGGVFEQRAEFGSERQAQRATRLCTNT